MYKTDYSKLDIDTSDIWKYEFDDLKVTTILLFTISCLQLLSLLCRCELNRF
jgi:hypothetical protein